MNKLIKYGLPGLLGLSLAMPAMAQSGSYGNQGSYYGNQNSNWRQGMNPQGQENWQGGQTGWNQSSNQDRNQSYGQNQNYGQNPNYGQSMNYGQNANQGGGNEQALTSNFTADIQRRLQQQGFYHQGSVDGVWGPETSNALENFQQRNNLRPTGQLDAQTLQALNVMNSQGGQNYGSNYSGQNYGNNSGQGQNYSSNYGQNSGSGGYNSNR